MKSPLKVVVLGSGAWGTALAKHVHRKGHDTVLWCRRQQLAKTINETHVNEDNLPNITLEGILATSDNTCTQYCDMVLVAVPSQHVRKTLLTVKVRSNTSVLICSKGIESHSLKLMTEVAKECLPKVNVMVLSGPTFATEVALGLPTAVTLSGTNTEKIRDALSDAYFRIYTTTDSIGTQVAGAVKNIIAIACGIVLSKKFGENARASLITRSLAEMTLLAVTLGAKKETILSGLCGVGDLMLTCFSAQSRNMSFGIALGKGDNPEDFLRQKKTIVEGFVNCQSIVDLAQKLDVDMPICFAVYDILYKRKSIEQTIENLLNRPQKIE